MLDIENSGSTIEMEAVSDNDPDYSTISSLSAFHVLTRQSPYCDTNDNTNDNFHFCTYNILIQKNKYYLQYNLF